MQALADAVVTASSPPAPTPEREEECVWGNEEELESFSIMPRRTSKKPPTDPEPSPERLNEIAAIPGYVFVGAATRPFAQMWFVSHYAKSQFAISST